MEKKFWEEIPVIILNSYPAWIQSGRGLSISLSIFKEKDRKEGGYFREFYRGEDKSYLSVGYFTENDMTEIFNKIEKSGFWQMPECLPSDILDGSYREIFVNYYWLEGKTREVVYHYGTPRTDEEINFMKLYDEIAALANTKPQENLIYEKH